MRHLLLVFAALSALFCLAYPPLIAAASPLPDSPLIAAEETCASDAITTLNVGSYDPAGSDYVAPQAQKAEEPASRLPSLQAVEASAQQRLQEQPYAARPQVTPKYGGLWRVTNTAHAEQADIFRRASRRFSLDR